jgi:hypothetical protein
MWATIDPADPPRGESSIEARGRELEPSVSQHGSLIETEEQSVHGAVTGYRESLDEFFARLARGRTERSLALPAHYPIPPTDAVRADARSRDEGLEEQEAQAVA